MVQPDENKTCFSLLFEIMSNKLSKNTLILLKINLIFHSELFQIWSYSPDLPQAHMASLGKRQYG